MLKTSTVESEDRLRLMLRPKGSEFKREMRLSINAETTKDLDINIEVPKDVVSVWEGNRELMFKILSALRDIGIRRTEHIGFMLKSLIEAGMIRDFQSTATTAQKILAEAETLADDRLKEKARWRPSIYGGYIPTSADLLLRSRKKMLFKPKKEPLFGVSLTGIRVKEDEITIDPKKLEQDVFYLFSHKDDKYVTRKIDENTLEVYEVFE